MGNIQYTHMGGGLDVPGPHVTLGPGTPPPPLKVSPLPFQFGLMWKQEPKVGGGLRTAVSSALLLVSRFIVSNIVQFLAKKDPALATDKKNKFGLRVADCPGVALLTSSQVRKGIEARLK